MGRLALLLLLLWPSAHAGDETPRWPPPPDPARVRFEGTLHGEAEVAKRAGWWQRMKNFVFGARERSRFVRPHGVAVTRDGVLLVADPGLPGVHVLDTRARSYHLIRDYDGEPFKAPIGVAAMGKETFVVCDAETAQVYELSLAGRAVRRYGTGLQRPTGVAVHPKDGRRFVVDTAQHRIAVYSAEGERLETLGRRGSEPGEFNFPVHAAFDAAGRLYVTDSLNFRVQIFDAELEPLSTFGKLGDRVGELSKPKGIAVSPEGRIHVVESYFNHLLIFDPSGTLLLAIGGNGDGPGQFSLPAGVAVHEDLIYVADAYNRRVQIFRTLPEPAAPVTPDPGAPPD